MPSTRSFTRYGPMFGLIPISLCDIVHCAVYESDSSSSRCSTRYWGSTSTFFCTVLTLSVSSIMIFSIPFASFSIPQICLSDISSVDIGARFQVSVRAPKGSALASSSSNPLLSDALKASLDVLSAFALLETQASRTSSEREQAVRGVCWIIFRSFLAFADAETFP